eukprot:m.185915 g.185915  ORF g.185915 m.185915 type:complete len:547 (+) comp16603_c0_seq1:446-2086(+)
MLTRAERKFDLAADHTPPTVAPGSYNGVPPPPRPMRVVDGRAPFGSQASRYQDSLYRDEEAAWPAPEPAQYSIVKYDTPITAPGGASMLNRSRRFVYPVKDGPDPAAYHVDRPFVKPHNVTVSKQRAAEARSLQLIAKSRMHTAAPIPARWEVNGYKEDKQTGMLVKAPTEVGTGDVGPASYGKVALDALPPATTANFAKRAARRDLFSAKRKADMPAPGAYNNPISAIAVTKPLRGPREGAPRWKSAASQAPAPNSYDVAQHTTMFRSTEVAKGKQFFGSTAARTGIEGVIKSRLEVPSPGTYSDPRRAINLRMQQGVNREMLQERKPFNQSTARFPRQRTVGPGPAGYNAESWYAGAPTLQNPHTMRAQTAAPFGGTAPRKSFTGSKFVGPPPGAYDTSRIGAIGAPSVHVKGAFRSTAPMRPQVKVLGPPPTAYDTRHVQGKVEPKRPTKNKRAVYVGSSERFKVHGTTQMGRIPDTSVPPPNAYVAPGSSLEHGKGGKFLDHTKSRFETSRHVTPAPNAYTTGSALLKPTFNATFDHGDGSS